MQLPEMVSGGLQYIMIWHQQKDFCKVVAHVSVKLRRGRECPSGQLEQLGFSTIWRRVSRRWLLDIARFCLEYVQLPCATGTGLRFV